ncbi:hypothetical protein M2164_008513 [Streptomyces sp. SAI-208]|uniref:hypothetical protein n=1 Tax=Streptomyces sp. SAI-208 TaxID=2940550 RepID=UPI0024770F37|nr:hypothetical protein [Streptomyces sp. SAI-208]MDH6612878.1 hypothetical protein [Streptomyces sp. SAI-208]
MTILDSVAERLVDQFFTQGQPASATSEQAHSRWRHTGQLDRITVSQLRLWATNRALEALTGPDNNRTTILKERELLNEWLDLNGYQALT